MTGWLMPAQLAAATVMVVFVFSCHGGSGSVS